MKQNNSFKIFLLLSLIMCSFSVNAQIISQYVETNSGTTPKGVEIWNNTAGTLDFATNNLEIKKGTNGAAPTTDITVSSGTLAPGHVMVIGTADMGTYLTGQGLTDVTFVTEPFTFNGDDALEVHYGGAITDMFGTSGSDPGSAWTGGGVSTRNSNIRLIDETDGAGTGISAGDTDGWTDPSTRFVEVNATPATLPAGLEGFGIPPVTTVWDGSTDTDWATAANWSNGVPTSSSHASIPDLANDPVIGATTGGVVNEITITNGVLSITAGGSLIVGSTSTGNFTYNVAVADTNWHLISAPVEGEQYDDAWNTLNSINVSGAGLNDGVSTYDNTTDANGNWDYFQTGGAATTFNTGQGYSLLRTAAGSYGFIGTMKTTNASIAITANDIGGGGENRWTLIGNPFPSYINISDFLTLTANATALTDTHESVYVWNGTAYVALTTGHIHPGQGFFVNSNVASTSVAINENMLSHQTGITFYRNPSTEPSIELTLTDGQKTRTTEIRYTSGKTTGLDPRFDIGTFTGTSNSFHVYTHLITDSQGVNFMRQTLPDANHESMIVPVGVNASSGDEITFTATALNIPNGLNVFIEDKDTNTFTRLDDTNAEYTVTLSGDLNGIGRFYLHTNTQQALDVDSFDLNSISIYKTNDETLRVAGLRNGNASLKIFDVLGKQVLQTNFEANGINDIALPNFKSGVYIIQLQTNNGNLNKKIIIE
jgi:hypothetical protein